MQAFIALGGKEGGIGTISKQKLKEVIKTEFGLQVDIDVSFILTNRN